MDGRTLSTAAQAALQSFATQSKSTCAIITPIATTRVWAICALRHQKKNLQTVNLRQLFASVNWVDCSSTTTVAVAKQPSNSVDWLPAYLANRLFCDLRRPQKINPIVREQSPYRVKVNRILSNLGRHCSS
jgi:hypothetical protein